MYVKLYFVLFLWQEKIGFPAIIWIGNGKISMKCNFNSEGHLLCRKNIPNVRYTIP